MYPHSFTISLLLLLLLLLLLCSLAPSHGTTQDLFSNEAPTKYLEVTHPLPTDYQIPTCSLHVFQLDVNVTEIPSVASNFSNFMPEENWEDPWCLSGYYSPPANCSGPWSSIIAELSASVSAKQAKRIAAVWFGGIEILRSSTVETVGHGAFWKVKKDVTRYASVLSKPTFASLVLKDAVKDTVSGAFAGSFHVNVSLHFYGGKASSVESAGGENAFKSRKLGFGGLELDTSHENERKFAALGDEIRELNGKSGIIPGKHNSVTGVLPESMNETEEEDKTQMEFPMKKFGESGNGSGVFLGKGTEENTKSVNLLKLPSEGGSGKVESYQLFYETPADLIIPVSSKGSYSSAYWFTIQNGSDLPSKEIKIPKNTYKAVLEIYVSSHANDEFWYSNPPNKSPRNKNLTVAPGKGAFRQVFASIDGLYVGSFVPFPIVYSGGIDPLFWDPIVAIGSFDLPAYDLDLTPLLGLLLDNKFHTFSLGITDATAFWFIDANLHLWLDHSSSHVTAALVKYRAPELKIIREYRFGTSKSRFRIKAEREMKFEGWVNSSMGNITAKFEHELEFKNTITIKDKGRFKEVLQRIKTETEIEVEAFSELLLAKLSRETKYPLEIKTETEHTEGNAYSTETKFFHQKEKKNSMNLPFGTSFSRNLVNSQKSEGRTVVKGQALLSGAANTEQEYKYRDERGCYIRNVVSGAGRLLEDSFSNTCLEMQEW